ncbi:murein L,D-transpeptidase, partial [Clostridium botulinum]|nr:murein L,D-transpeptidase [Clostridium botulinum]
KINKNIHINKSTVYILLFTLIILTTLFHGYQYKKLVNNFKIDFDSNKFSQANNILLTQENFNPFKNLMLKRDLKKYFSNNITTLKQDLETSKLNEEEILIKANEINRYGFNSNEVIELVNSVSSLQDSINNYSNGIEHFNNNEYYEAITNFSNLSPLDLNYNESLIYLRESKSKIKDELFSKC